jgi:prolipoprotein diacylglyceryltransferase
VYQVLVRIFGLPVYGFGMMLFLAFLVCTWLAGRRAERAGISPQRIQDLAIWLFVGGLVGARLAFIFAENQNVPLPVRLSQFFRVWDGGLVLYGSVAGGIVGYLLAYQFALKKYQISSWQLADVIAPSVAIGIALGRVGCLLNGCCYGAVACSDCPALSYPLPAPARFSLVDAGYQTAAGFTFASQGREPARVGAVEPESPAARSGLRAGDVIVRADEHEIRDASDLSAYLGDSAHWPRGKADLSLTVLHPGEKDPVTLPAFRPWTLGLHPTQLYETISMLLLLFLVLAYEPFKRRDGELIAIVMAGYGLHRLLNEMLRSDPRPEGFESYVSMLLIAAGVTLWAWRRMGGFTPAPAETPAFAGSHPQHPGRD